MASLTRTAKSGNDWGIYQLFSYNISIQFQDAATFFGVDSLPEPQVPHEVLTTLKRDDMTDDLNYKLLRYMDMATRVESGAADFAVSLLTLLGYVPRTRMIRRHVDLPLEICREECHGTSDACIVDDRGIILLLVQEDKRNRELKDPEAQLIAEAIAAFQRNNVIRQRQARINAKVMPGIVLVGSSPIFYKIPITDELVQAVEVGEYPATPTVVHAHLPVVPRPGSRLYEGMKPLDNRRQILACFEAFKQFVNWSAFHYY